MLLEGENSRLYEKERWCRIFSYRCQRSVWREKGGGEKKKRDVMWEGGRRGEEVGEGGGGWYGIE